MPELPEVETYANDLAPVLVGRVFSGAWVDWPNQLPLNTPEELDKRIDGQAVLSVGRRGKYLTIKLYDDWLFVHLKMSGRLEIRPAVNAPDPWAHVVLSLNDGDELRFVDPRKFGRVYLVADRADVVGKLGPEPLSDGFTTAALEQRLSRRRARLKPLLLDQTFVAGLGNIYVDESLWHAGLHPVRTADALTTSEVAGLHRSIREVLARAIEARGSSLRDRGYRDLTGNMGEMQDSLAVYGRTDAPCRRCGTAIERFVLSGRGTHWCPSCQPIPS